MCPSYISPLGLFQGVICNIEKLKDRGPWSPELQRVKKRGDLRLLSIPCNKNISANGQDPINLPFKLYSNSRPAIYEGRTKLSPPILKYKKKSPQLEYAGYKKHACPHYLELADKISGLQKNTESRLALTKAKKQKPQKTMKKIKRKLKLIQDKKQSQVPVDGLIGDVVIKAAFPNITKLVLLYSLVPQSEFVNESGFSCI